MKNLSFLFTSPKLRAGRKGRLLEGETRLRQCALGELRRLATVSRPDICARLSRIASRINSPCGIDIYRINDPHRLEKKCQKATALKYASPHRPWRALDFTGQVKDNMRNKGE